MRKPIEFAQLEWDNHGQPRSRLYNDIYFFSSSDPTQNGLAESRYVFLQNNHLTERWRAFKKDSTGHNSFVIAETGFGTGLNFLATWQLWEQQSLQHTFLHYISIEKHPFRPKDLKQILAAWPELQEFTQQLIAHYPRLFAEGFYSLAFPASRIFLTLIIGDVEDALRQCLQSTHPSHAIPYGRGVDAWYLDGFAPSRNPAMWSETVLQSIAQLSKPEATLATFTAAGLVQRQLKSLGFALEKIPGFGHKREMLRGKLSPAVNLLKKPEQYSKYPQPCAVLPFKDTPLKQVAVIGAGLAGCHSARALAELGWQVTVLDSATTVADGASGNAQGIVYAKLSADDDALAQFNLSALLVAAQTYQPWWQSGSELGQACGVLQVAYNEKERRLWQQCLNYFEIDSFQINRFEANSLDIDSNADCFLDVQFLKPEAVNELTGFDLPFAAMFFPQLGWLNPKLLCQRLLDHPNIRVQLNTTIDQLHWQETEQHWLLRDRLGNTCAQSSAVIIANAFAAAQFTQTQTLPIKKIRGQVTYLADSQCLESVKTVICGESYIAPLYSGNTQSQTLGATFNLGEDSSQLRSDDHRCNIDSITKLVPEFETTLNRLDPTTLSGRVHFRCTSPDYLPIVGPVHQHEDYVAKFAKLRTNANTPIHQPGNHWPGLFINVGHGSRGLAYTPLCARLLAAYINGDPLPVSQTLANALHPGRFTIRGLIRRQF